MKEQLRKEFLNKRNDLTKEEVISKSKVIIEKLKQDSAYKNAKTIMFYVSKDNEVFTHDLIKETDKKIVVPKMIDNKIECCKIDNFDELELGSYDILEPKECKKCNLDEIDLIIVPGIVFDKENHRIGFGGGYYDDLLKNCKCLKIGLAYEFQIIDNFPKDEWDIKVDKVVD